MTEHELDYSSEEIVRDNEIVVHIGDIILVKLRARLGTGFRWELDSLTGESIELLEQSIANPGTGLKPGASELQLFRFVARVHGTQSLVFNYLQPWRRIEPPEKSLEVMILVT